MITFIAADPSHVAAPQSATRHDGHTLQVDACWGHNEDEHNGIFQVFYSEASIEVLKTPNNFVDNVHTREDIAEALSNEWVSLYDSERELVDIPEIQY